MFFKRALFFAAAAVPAALFLADCGGRNPGKAHPVPAISPAVAPMQTNVPPEQVVHPIPPASSADTLASNILAWDSAFKTYRARRGETNANFTFHLKNVSRETIAIYDTSTSCDCTVARMPPTPWHLAPGAAGQIEANVDLRYKIGSVTNYIIVFTSKGNKLLLLKTVAPKP